MSNDVHMIYSLKSDTNLEKILPSTDVLYMTRIQKERFKTEEEYKNVTWQIDTC